MVCFVMMDGMGFSLVHFVELCYLSTGRQRGVGGLD